MRYLIIMAGQAPFFTDYFDPENHFVDGMTAIDMQCHQYFNGNAWADINGDSL